MAEPRELKQPTPQLEVRSLNETGWIVPAGWYGMVPAAGVGIVRMSGVDEQIGLDALERLGAPEPDSRSKAFDGRRLVRIDGGYVILNYVRYRDKDTTAAERSRRWRERNKGRVSNAVTLQRNGVTATATQRNDTIAEGEVEAEVEGRKEGNVPPTLPPADRTERALRQSTDGLRTKLYALIDAMVQEDPKQRDPTELMRLVTEYDKPDGKHVKGVVNAGGLSHERLEKSCEDAESHLAGWRKNGQV